MEEIFVKSAISRSNYNLKFTDPQLEAKFLEYMQPLRKEFFYFVSGFVVLYKLLSVLYVLFSFKEYVYVSLGFIQMVFLLGISLLSRYDWYIKIASLVKIFMFSFVYFTETYLIIRISCDSISADNLIRYIYLLILCSASSSVFFHTRRYILMITIFLINTVLLILLAATFGKPVIFEIFVNILSFLISFKININSDFRIRKEFLHKMSQDTASNYVKSVYDGLNSLVVTCTDQEKYFFNEKVGDIIANKLDYLNENTDFKSLYKTRSLFKNDTKIDIKNSPNKLFSHPTIKIENDMCDLTLGKLVEKESAKTDNRNVTRMLGTFQILECKDETLQSIINTQSNPSRTLYDLLKLLREDKSIPCFERFKILGYFEFVHKKQSTSLNSSKALSSRSMAKDQSYFEVFFRKIHIDGVVIVEFLINDITTLKHLENVKIEAKYKHKILSKIAHEFKTPLIALMGVANKMLGEFGQDTKNFRRLIQIQNMSHYIIYLVNDIIEYFNSNGKVKVYPEEFRIKPLMEFFFNVLKMLLKQKQKTNIDAIFEMDSDLDNLLMTNDVNRIHQIMFNLITNAVKYTNKGYIKIVASKGEVPNSLKIVVFDTGKGIKMRKLAKINSDIKQLKINIEEDYNVVGSCIGLMISKKIASEINSTLIAESEFGKGTKFSFEIKNITQGLKSYPSVHSLARGQTKFTVEMINSPEKSVKESALDFSSRSRIRKEKSSINSKGSSSSDNDSQDVSIKQNSQERNSIIRLDEIERLQSDEEDDKTKKIVALNFNLNFSGIDFATHRTIQKKFSANSKFSSRLDLNDRNEKEYIIKPVLNREKKKSRSSKFLSPQIAQMIPLALMNHDTRRKNSSNTINQTINNININLQNNNIALPQNYNININCDGKKTSSSQLIKDKTLKSDTTTTKLAQSRTLRKSIFFAPTPQSIMSHDAVENMSSINLEKKVILLIDDYKHCTDMVENLLKSILKDHLNKFDIIKGTDGIELLYQMSKNIPLLCVFIDENMDYMCGSEAISIARQWQKKLTIQKFTIFSVTAFSDEITRSRIEAAGVDYIIDKPVGKAKLDAAFKDTNFYKLLEDL